MILQATPPWLTAEHYEEIAMKYECAVLCAQLTGVGHEVDHEQPLKGRDRCGLHIPINLQIIAWHDNHTKSNRTK